MYLLQSLAAVAKNTPSLADDAVFISELSIALYVLPVVFGGIGVNLIRELTGDLADYMERKGYSSVEEFRGIARERVVEHSRVRRKSDAYNGGYAQAAQGPALAGAADPGGSAAQL